MNLISEGATRLREADRSEDRRPLEARGRQAVRAGRIGNAGRGERRQREGESNGRGGGVGMEAKGRPSSSRSGTFRRVYSGAAMVSASKTDVENTCRLKSIAEVSAIEDDGVSIYLGNSTGWRPVVPYCYRVIKLITCTIVVQCIE
mmetsp:Transcript_22468/g.50013  ORF Transcript_22468/g.50013 Transcript_22468/m.50013 type:complete len:146 (-) Transcript_22468:74-511(-)